MSLRSHVKTDKKITLHNLANGHLQQHDNNQQQSHNQQQSQAKHKHPNHDTQKNLFIVKSNEERNKALDSALNQIEKIHGRGSIMRLGQHDSVDVDAISTGSLGLDLALGIGGLPRGRVVEIYGPESSGKTTLALHVIAETQKIGGNCAFIDAEHAMDPGYARKLGVNLESLLISQPDAGEQALEIADTLVRSGAIDVLVIDSVAALVPRAELEGEMGDTHVGLHARLMSQALRKLTSSVARSRCMIVFINQIRLKIGVMFGNPETTTGGNALKFYASVRLDIRRVGSVKDKDEITGNQTRVKVVKNKLAPPFRQVEFDIIYGEGISKLGEILDLGVQAELIEKSGSWFSYGNQRIGQGRETAKKWLADHPQHTQNIENQIRQKAGLLQDSMIDGSSPSHTNTTDSANTAEKPPDNAVGDGSSAGTSASSSAGSTGDDSRSSDASPPTKKT